MFKHMHCTPKLSQFIGVNVIFALLTLYCYRNLQISGLQPKSSFKMNIDIRWRFIWTGTNAKFNFALPERRKSPTKYGSWKTWNSAKIWVNNQLIVPRNDIHYLFFQADAGQDFPSIRAVPQCRNMRLDNLHEGSPKSSLSNKMFIMFTWSETLKDCIHTKDVVPCIP